MRMKKSNYLFHMNTVRKKVLLLSKLVGGIIVIFYLVTLELPAKQDISFWIWFVLMVTVILGVDFLLGRMISKPLEEINFAAGKMAELDFTASCDVHTNDEFGELSKSLNIMSANLQNALTELENMNVKLENTNQRLENTNVKLETANEKLGRDIEHERLLLKERKELVDHLSHEMKTPLGLIRAYTEGLKEEEDEEKRQKYMDSILSAADRMNHMIISLLDLSALEAGAAKLSEERFDFIELTETVAGRLLLDVPDTEYDFTFEIPEQKVFVLADKKRMEQVLINLIENAKKHVYRDGKLHLEVCCLEKELHFSIFNEGNLIPDEELPKIWSKFYRGRQEGKGGSGLGLAIVAQILSMYGISCAVCNCENGVEFSFCFPVSQ